ncbi:FmdE family protein [Methanogenium marinum]|uniref:FmdE family protein n=1 Tax=Methanogenium marinum TaxID=348610 RepID=A0A9Q4PY92_9EURY|nr:FmdE family protein [Methanogenium marinum]MDE4908233.1 FmdE family protein [Methanogenium marinum]
MTVKLPPFEEVAVFHGHICPGLAFGYRASEYAKECLNADRSEDEEMVAIVENDACMIDAIQYITGCTMGKGNMIFRDHGKPVYTFILRNGEKAVRIAQKPAFGQENLFPDVVDIQARMAEGTATDADRARMQEIRTEMIEKILTAPLDEIYECKEVKPELPERARIFRSVPCAVCGEPVSEQKARVQDGKIVCIPCFDEYTRGW